VRVILDTNSLLSALIRRDRLSGRILEAWFDDRFVLLTHPLQLDELRAVDPAAADPHPDPVHPRPDGWSFRSAPCRAGRRPAPTRRSDDPADDFLLAMSEAGEADYLGTGDKVGLLALRCHHGTRILTARAFLDVLTG
jgi:uncharacterized protein